MLSPHETDPRAGGAGSAMIALWAYPLLFLTGLSAGFVDSIAGGGGLITVPVLLNLGLPPQLALGTNKLQAVFGSGSATFHYGRAGLIDFKASGAGVLFTFIGAVWGTLTVQRIAADFLNLLIPGLLAGLALYLLFQPQLGMADLHPRLPRRWFHLGFGLLIGFYDGFFGPGTGTFWAMAFVLGLGFNLTKATAHTKLVNFTSNAASLLVFAVAQQTHMGAGLCMGVGQVVGARLGARIVIRRGARFIRPVFILIALALTGKLLWEKVAQ